MKYIGIDCGRDFIKSIYYEDGEFKKYGFSARFIDNVDFDYLKNISILNFNEKEHIIGSINDGGIKIYGKFCNKLSRELSQMVIAEDRYIEYSLEFILVTIAEILDGDDDVIIGLNLTANSINKKDKIRGYLKDRFNVKLYNNVGRVIKDVNFNIVEVGVWFQGWTSYLNYAINDDLDVVKEYIYKDVLLIDIGRATVDVVFISELSNAKTMAYNLGCEVIFSRIAEELYNKYDIRRSSFDVSNIVLNNKIIYDNNGVEINWREILDRKVELIGNEIYNSILNNFADYLYDTVYLCGGGVYFFEGLFKKYFKNLVVMDDFIYSNCKGLLKMILRKFLKKKVGLSENSSNENVLFEK